MAEISSPCLATSRAHQSRSLALCFRFALGWPLAERAASDSWRNTEFEASARAAEPTNPSDACSPVNAENSASSSCLSMSCSELGFKPLRLDADSDSSAAVRRRDGALDAGAFVSMMRKMAPVSGSRSTRTSGIASAFWSSSPSMVVSLSCDLLPDGCTARLDPGVALAWRSVPPLFLFNRVVKPSLA